MKILKNLAIGLGTLGLMMSVTSCGQKDTPASNSTQSESEHEHTHDHSSSDSSGSTSESGSSTTGGSSSTTTPTTPTVHTHTWGDVHYEFTSANGNYSITARRDCTTCDEHEEETVSAVKTVTKGPTCTETGSAVVVSDDFTNSSFAVQTKTVTLDALGHNKVHHEEVDATCENDGHSEYDECSRCGEITGYVKYEKLGHNYQISYTWSDDLTAVTATRICLNNESDVVSETANVITQVTKNATCTENGSKNAIATFVNPIFETQTRNNIVITASHNLKTISGYAATCTTNGLTDKIYCETCGEVIQEATAITAHHDWETVDYVQATCAHEGSTGYLRCKICGVAGSVAETIEKLNRHECYYSVGTTATCTTSGYIIWKCVECGEEWIDEKIEVEPSSEYHNVVTMPAKEPTSCLEDGKGYKEYKYCSICGEIITSKVEVFGEHKYEADGWSCVYCGEERDYNDNGEVNPSSFKTDISYLLFGDSNLYPTKINGLENTLTVTEKNGTKIYTSNLDSDYKTLSENLNSVLKLNVYENANGKTQFYLSDNYCTISTRKKVNGEFIYITNGEYKSLDISVGTNLSSFSNGEVGRIKFYLKDGSVVEKTYYSSSNKTTVNFSFSDVEKIDVTLVCLNHGASGELNEWIDVEYKNVVMFCPNNEHVEGDVHSSGFKPDCFNVSIIKNSDYLNYFNTVHYYEDTYQQNQMTGSYFGDIIMDYYLSESTFTITEEEILNGTVQFNYIILNVGQYEISMPSDLTAGTYKIKIHFESENFGEVEFVPVTE